MQTLDLQNVNCKKGATDRGVFQIRDWKHVWGSRTLLMGIVNVTPDSFSGDGVMQAGNAEAGVQKALDQIAQGADIIDIGGESSRPVKLDTSQRRHCPPVDEQTELGRVIPVITALRKLRPDAIISIDTNKPEVLRQAVAAGADILNSIWGLKDDLLSVVADLQIPVVIMHNQETPVYDELGVVDNMLNYLYKHAQKALSAGIKPENIILDPGIGFGKVAEQSIEVHSKLDRLVGLGFPTLLGTSRKSFMGEITGQPVENREYATAASVALGIACGIDIVRVHDVAHMKDVVRTSDAIMRGWQPIDFSKDSIQIKQIRAYGKHGVTDAEREHNQPFDIDLELKTDLTKAQGSDDIEDTVNYSAINKQVVEVVQHQSFKLLERLADVILESLFSNKKILAARIRIAKPERLNGATPSVVLTRRNQSR